MGRNGTKKFFSGSSPGFEKPIPCLLRCMSGRAMAGFGRGWQAKIYRNLPGRLLDPVSAALKEPLQHQTLLPEGRQGLQRESLAGFMRAKAFRPIITWIP